MAVTNFPQGVSSFGVPVLGGGPQIPVTTGTYFWVDSGHANANATNAGTDKNYPLSTIDAAIGLTTAAAGDVIIVAPGHAETISSATALVVDVAGISIVGLGHGRNRPVISFDNTASRIPVSADNVVIDNLVFLGAVADIVSGVTVTGDDVTIRNCDWEVGSAVLEFLQMLDIDAATRARIINCRFIANATAGTNTGIRIDACVDSLIQGCELRGDFTTAAISGTTGTGAASTNFAIIGNLIENRDTTAGTLLDHHDDSTGITAYNSGFTLFATAPETAVDPGDTLNTENYVVNAVDEAGTIVPTTLST